ncbi:MAG TPA: hypothetical protein VHD60_01695 [Candidatus Saccharimonadales bacterium]|nr:hypothetical protein [Candidatus Saccharimonadales bacterium]
MFLLSILTVGGLTFVAVTRPWSTTSGAGSGEGAGIVVGVIALLIPLFLISFFVLWLDDTTGISRMIEDSFKFFSGVNSPSDVVAGGKICSGTGVAKGLFFLLLTVVLLLSNFIFGLVGVVGIPFGIIGCLVGAVYSFFSGEVKSLVWGLAGFLIPLASIILAGLNMRAVHALSGALWGC